MGSEGDHLGKSVLESIWEGLIDRYKIEYYINKFWEKML